MTARAPVTALVHTRNEEARIRSCLETLRWAEEILVVDMESEDRTREIAGEFTDRIVTIEPMGHAEPARAFGVSNAAQPWVFMVDADELVSVALRDRLLRVIRGDEADVVYIPRVNYFFGKPVRGAGFGPLQDRLPRFFRAGSLTLDPRPHGVPRPTEGARILRLDDPDLAILHLVYRDVEHFVEKLDRYTTLEADSMWRGEKRGWSLPEVAVRTVKEGVGRFLLKGGWRDGLRGLELSLLMVIYRWVAWMKYRLMRERETPEPGREIEAEYARMAEEVIREHREEQRES